MAQPDNKLQLSLMGGMNRKTGPLIIKDDECELCDNYILDNLGTLQKRGGYSAFGGIPVATSVNGLYTFTDSSNDAIVNLMVGNNSGGTQGVIYVEGANGTFALTTSGNARIIIPYLALKPATAGTPGSLNGGAVANGTSNSASSLTVSTTVAAGNNRMLVVTITTAGGITNGIPSGVTYGGVAMTSATSGGVDVTASMTYSVWILAGAAVGTANVVATFPGTVQAIMLSAQAFDGMSQAAGTGPVRTSGSASTTGASTLSTTITGYTSSDLLVALGYNDTNRTQTIGAATNTLSNQTATSATLADTLRMTFLYKFPGVWMAVKTNDTASKRTRFSTFVDYVFRVNGADVVATSADGLTWGTTNAPATITPRYTGVFQDRSYMAHGGISNKSRMWFSSLPAAGVITWDLTNNWVDVNPDDGDEITGVENNGNRFLIFKHRALYRWNFGQVEPDRVIGVGTDSQESVATNFDLGITFFANQRGVYSYSGNRPKLLSRKIQPFVDAVSDWSSVYGGVDNDHYYLYVGDITVDGRTYNKASFVYHISLDAWSIFELGNAITIFASMLGVGTGQRLCFGTTIGTTNLSSFNLVAADGTATYTSDNGTAITAEFISKEYLLRFPERTNLAWIDLFSLRRGNAVAFYDLDRENQFQELEQLTQRITNVRIPDRECNSVRVRVLDVGTSGSQQSSTFEGFNLEHVPKDKRDEVSQRTKKPGYGR